MTTDDMSESWETAWQCVHEALQQKERGTTVEQIAFTFTTEDIQGYCLEQLERDSKMGGDHLTLEEYRAMLNMLLLAEQTEALKRIAARLTELAER